MQHAHPISAGIFSSTSLKRTRSSENLPPLSTEIPRLPEINPDLVLEVYTHESLRPPNAIKPEDFTDNRRLSKLGESVLNTVMTVALFKVKPLLSPDEIKERRESMLNDDVIQGWVKSYQMALRILCLAEYQSKRDTPEECRRVFCAYVGAVFLNSGQEVVGKWIELLVKHHEQHGAITPTSAETPPAKKIKNEPLSSLDSFTALSPSTSTASTASTSTSTSTSSAQTYSPTAPYLNTSQQYPSTYLARQVPPHMSKSSFPTQIPSPISSNTSPMRLDALFQSLTKLSQSSALRAVTGNQSQRTQSMVVDGKMTFGQGIAPPLGLTQSRPNPLAPATPNAPFLPMFNQSANQRGVKVDYSAEFEGPAHAGQWMVECLVNGIPKGKGKGSSKQIAKEEAARQAYYSMGWT